MENIDNIYWNALHVVFDLGATDFARFRSLNIAPQKLWKLSALQLQKYGISDRITNRWDERLSVQPEKLWKQLVIAAVEFLTIEDQRYPKELAEIFSPPPFLYTRGDMRVLQKPKLAIVGTRRASNYGKTVTERLAKELAETGFVIVSGLAFGIDAAAHTATLIFDSATIAVLGSGVDSGSVSPRNNQPIAERIVQKHGLIVSEFPPHVNTYAGNFPRRNRIISGLSKGVIVIEAAQKSGALITAHCALDQNRDVFALPGDITRTVSEGTNRLIQSGAIPVLQTSDILEQYGVACNPKATQSMPPDQAAIAMFLQEQPSNFDQLLTHTQLSYSTLQSTLLAMEMHGLIAKNAGMYYNL